MRSVFGECMSLPWRTDILDESSPPRKHRVRDQAWGELSAPAREVVDDSFQLRAQTGQGFIQRNHGGFGGALAERAIATLATERRQRGCCEQKQAANRCIREQSAYAQRERCDHARIERKRADLEVGTHPTRVWTGRICRTRRRALRQHRLTWRQCG